MISDEELERMRTKLLSEDLIDLALTTCLRRDFALSIVTECLGHRQLKTPKKILLGRELEKEGYYWHRYEEDSDWEIVSVYKVRDEQCYWEMDTFKKFGLRAQGHFIGPIKMPEGFQE